MRLYIGTVIGLIALVASVAGCSTVSQPESGLNTNPNQEIIQTSAVDTSYPGLKRIIASEYLVSYISVVNPKLGSVGNFSKAQVTVQNLTQNRYELEYQYQWEDEGGFSVGSPHPWKRFVLGSKEAKNFPEMALRQEADQVIFTVRLVDDTFIELNKQLEKK
jgi:uncharacterized protein YcfL